MSSGFKADVRDHSVAYSMQRSSGAHADPLITGGPY